MNYLLSLLGFGDCLITFTIIENARQHTDDFKIIGTKVSENVSSLMNSPPAIDYKIFDEVPAFYAVRKHGAASAAADVLRLRRYLRTIVKPRDTLIFEKSPSLRNRAMVCGLGCKTVEVPKRSTAYSDRSTAFAPFFGLHSFEKSPKPSNRATSLLLNPSARIKEREIPLHSVREIVRHALKNSVAVTLIDVDGTYKSLQAEVGFYIEKPTLEVAASHLRGADCYVGPDSFFLHLAYYYGVPSLAFFLDDHPYFQPPGIQENGFALKLADLEKKAFVETSLDRLFC